VGLVGQGDQAAVGHRDIRQFRIGSRSSIPGAGKRCVVIEGLENTSGRPGSAGTVTAVCRQGVVAMDGVNVVKPSGYSAGKGIWEERTGAGTTM